MASTHQSQGCRQGVGGGVKGEGRGARGRVRASTWATDLRRCPKHAYGHSPGLLVKEVPYALHNPQCKKFEFGKYLLATV